MAFITDEKYENLDQKYYLDLDVDPTVDQSGFCFGIKIENDLPNIDVKVYVEMMDGITPAKGRGRKDKVNSQ